MIVLLILYIVTDPHHPVPMLYLRDFFNRLVRLCETHQAEKLNE